LDEIKKLAEQTKEEISINNYLVSAGAYRLADDPQKKLIPPVVKDIAPEFDFSALKASLDTLGHLSATLHELQINLAGSTDKRKEKVNELLFQAEKSLLIENGLPRRPWYKHSIYAPGFYTGYSVKTLPGIREAIEERHWQEANEQIIVATEAIRRLNKSIELAISLAKSIVPAANKPLTQSAQPSGHPVKVLLVTAHPDDETLLAATAYKITHELGGIVDQVVITNGEGGYSYSLLSEPIYHLKLATEPVGREHLPEIRKQELLNAGKILGIRNHYLLDQKDARFGLDIREPLDTSWNINWVSSRLTEILVKNKYDYVFTLLPDSSTHAHHKAATVLALQAVESLKEKPVVLAVATANKSESVKAFFQLANFPIAKVSSGKYSFQTDRTIGFAPLNQLNYKIIVNWVIAEHKSQGTLQNMANDGDYENFWYFDLNGTDKFEQTKRFFELLSNMVPK
jgi:LmbE family N-acetylglucosaminyl deacetylase